MLQVLLSRPQLLPLLRDFRPLPFQGVPDAPGLLPEPAEPLRLPQEPLPVEGDQLAGPGDLLGQGLESAGRGLGPGS